MGLQGWDIRITSPCRKKRWEDLGGDDCKRFCEECGQFVYNFAELTRREQQELIRGAEGRVCVVLYRRADGTVVTKECPPAHRRAWAAIAGAYFSAAALLAAGKPGRIRGAVKDATGAPIAKPRVTLSDEAREREAGKREDGSFDFSELTAGTYKLRVEAPGFRQDRREIVLREGQEVAVEIELQVGSVGGPMEVEPIRLPIGKWLRRLFR